MRTTQQPVAVCGAIKPTPPLLFSIEVEKHIFDRLTDLSAKSGIPIKILASEILRTFLALHRTELKKLIDQIKRNHHCPAR